MSSFNLFRIIQSMFYESIEGLRDNRIEGSRATLKTLYNLLIGRWLCGSNLKSMIKIHCRILKMCVVSAAHIFDRCYHCIYTWDVYVESGEIRLWYHCVCWFIAVSITDRFTQQNSGIAVINACGTASRSIHPPGRTYLPKTVKVFLLHFMFADAFV